METESQFLDDYLTKEDKSDKIDSDFKESKNKPISKYIIIINGRGGSGKDSLIEFVQKDLEDKIAIDNISSITPIKKIAKKIGCDISDKNPKNRKFLSDLKKLLTEYNDYSMDYLISETNKFIDKKKQGILFVHIRETEEIDRYKKLFEKYDTDENISIKVLTMLVTRDGIEDYGNSSDDNVENYNYDLHFENNDPLIVSEHKFALTLVSKLKDIDWS